uniref:Uncharacterized protein n=1 Tax=Arundo donax TaxID=35708 RepID=A0A0A9EPD0_ARUDO
MPARWAAGTSSIPIFVFFSRCVQ